MYRTNRWGVKLSAAVQGEFLDADALWQLLSDRRDTNAELQALQGGRSRLIAPEPKEDSLSSDTMA